MTVAPQISSAELGRWAAARGDEVVLCIQSDREWRVLAAEVLDDKALASDPNFATNVERVKRRTETDGFFIAVIRKE